jgi:hypothetical protein
VSRSDRRERRGVLLQQLGEEGDALGVDGMARIQVPEDDKLVIGDG